MLRRLGLTSVRGERVDHPGTEGNIGQRPDREVGHPPNGADAPDRGGSEAATDTAWAPWYIADADDKKRARLNIISHLLSQVPHKPFPHRDITLPTRQQPGGYTEPGLPLRYIPAPY